MPFGFQKVALGAVALLGLGSLLLGPTRAHAQSFLSPRPGLPLGAPSPPVGYRAIGWDALTPPGWNAMKGFDSAELRAMDDADPRAAAMLKKMREAWDKAPVNIAIVGQPVRIAGYVVPLEESAAGLTEFLLVPTYGACIHTPPPPSNQIIHVVPRAPSKVKSMDVVWISGVLTYFRNDSTMGTSSWRLEAVAVQPYSGASSGSGSIATVPLR